MIEALRSHSLFQKLDEAQLQRVARSAVRIQLSESEALFEQGDAANRFFLLLRGQIKLFRLSPEGNEKIIELVSAGETFAEALMFLDLPRYPVCASALTDAELISIDCHEFASMLRDSIDTCFLLMGDMSQRLRRLIKEIDDLSLQSGTRRVAGYLLSKAGDPARDAFRLDIPKGVMASRLSLKPETFSRIIRDLHERGILTVTRDFVEIHDRDALLAETALTDFNDSGMG
jgi:CRP-like cAMP-binding protein